MNLWMEVTTGFIHLRNYGIISLQSYKLSVAVIERKINRSIRPVRNRELLQDLLRLLLFLVDWLIAGEVGLLCTTAVLARPGCTGRAGITPACWSLIAGVRGDIRTVPTRFSVDLFIQSQQSRIQFIDPLHFLAWISWSQLSSYSSYGTQVISLNPLLIPSLFLHLSWWRFFSSSVCPLFTPPAPSCICISFSGW